MKWTVRAEMTITGPADEVEALLDSVMESLLDLGVEDPSVSAEISSGAVELGFLVEGESIDEVSKLTREIYQSLPQLRATHESGRHIAELTPA